MSESDVQASEAGEGGGTEGPSPSKESEIAGLKAALQAVRERERDHKSEVEKLKAKVDELSQKPAKEYSRAELQQAVDNGRMSQDEADRILEQQQQRKLDERVDRRVEEEASRRELQARLHSEIGKYTSVYPDILQEGSDNRARVAREFDRQVDVLGKPKNLQTELDALAVIFGPPETLSKGQDKPRETYQGVGSDGGGEPKKDQGPKLPAHVKDHYSKMIDKGMYKGWDDPTLQKEIKQYARPGW